MTRCLLTVLTPVLLGAAACSSTTSSTTQPAQSTHRTTVVGSWHLTSWDGAALPKSLTCAEGPSNTPTAETVTAYALVFQDSVNYSQQITFASSPQGGPRTETRSGNYMLLGTDSVQFHDASTGGTWQLSLADSLTMRTSSMWVLGCPNVFFQAVFRKDAP